ncbi:spore germination lipoprotein GerD [Paenibacillus sp. B2(2019)]|uniref:spore germination lipoprotein GerD n=1 Tax=Paenibacillus sp. B2(2019) TaxID=2607754 RepID=UPI0011F3265F|nr:spore germination lipoprotein GerD [Paenibacillus sp. B2(2019)]KAA1182978.1 spore gernimation protein [Paenibacillus sp. B2(2019)]
MKWRFIGSVGLALSFVMALTACGSEQSSSSSGQGSYKETKTMVLDILKSDEGKKAVEESLSSSSSSGSSGMSMKMMPLQTTEEIKLAVKNTLTAPEYQKEIEKIMTDPKFAGDFAKAIQSQSKELHLQLIKDPTYQKSVEEIMKSPEMMTMFLNLTKTPDYRKQSMKTMQESMQTPLFRMEVLNLLKKVVQEELEPKEKKEKGSEGGDKQESSGGGSGDDSSS